MIKNCLQCGLIDTVFFNPKCLPEIQNYTIRKGKHKRIILVRLGATGYLLCSMCPNMSARDEPSPYGN